MTRLLYFHPWFSSCDVINILYFLKIVLCQKCFWNSSMCFGWFVPPSPPPTFFFSKDMHNMVINCTLNIFVGLAPLLLICFWHSGPNTEKIHKNYKKIPGNAEMKSLCNIGFRKVLICPCWKWHMRNNKCSTNVIWSVSVQLSKNLVQLSLSFKYCSEFFWGSAWSDRIWASVSCQSTKVHLYDHCVG